MATAHFNNPYQAPISVPNPKVPFDGNIPNGMQPGKHIIIKGHVQPKAQDFRIDLLTQQNYIALHINPRFNQNAVVRNTDRAGWGEEERTGPFPFKTDKPFEMLIAAEHDHFKVSVDGKHLFDYKYRLPVSEINRISIKGQVDGKAIVFVGGAPPRGHESFNPPIPSAIPILGGLKPGKLIQINGQVPNNVGRFEINLQVGPGVQPNDIGLHFNPRWNCPNSSQPIVIRTHRRSGGWGTEDKLHPPFPFQKGANFEMLILCDAAEYKVAVNGQHFISYRHQIPFQAVDHIGFGGDIIINAVRQFQQ